MKKKHQFQHTLHSLPNGLFKVTAPGRYNPDGNGRRVRKQFQTKAEAQAYIDARVVDLLNNGQALASLDPAVRHDALNAKRLLTERRIDLTLVDCARIAIAKVERENRSCTLSELFAKLVDDWDAKVAAAKIKKNYSNDLKLVCTRFASWIGAEKNLAAITPEDVEDFLQTLDLSPKRVGDHYDVLRLSFRFAVRKRLIDVSPVDPIDPPHIPDYQPGILHPEDVQRLLNGVYKFAPEFLGYYVASFFLGIRSAEICRLDWAQIDLETMTALIKKGQSKTNESRTVYIPPNAKYWFRLCHQGSGPILTPAQIHDLFENRADVISKVEAETGAELQWLFNCGRHSFSTYHLGYHNDRHFTCSQTGHSPEMLKKHYEGEAAPGQAEAFFQILPPGVILDQQDSDPNAFGAVVNQSYGNGRITMRWPRLTAPESKSGIAA